MTMYPARCSPSFWYMALLLHACLLFPILFYGTVVLCLSFPILWFLLNKQELHVHVEDLSATVLTQEWPTSEIPNKLLITCVQSGLCVCKVYTEFCLCMKLCELLNLLL